MTEKILEYLIVREKRLGVLLNGLLNSKKRCGNTGNWTINDEKELNQLKGREKECQEIKQLITLKGLDKKHKDIQFYIDKQHKGIEKIKKRKIENE